MKKDGKLIEKIPTKSQTRGIFIIIRKNKPEINRKYCDTKNKPFVLRNSRVKIESKTMRPNNNAKLFQLPTRFPDDTPCKRPREKCPKPMNIQKSSKIEIIEAPRNNALKKYHNLFSV